MKQPLVSKCPRWPSLLVRIRKRQRVRASLKALSRGSSRQQEDQQKVVSKGCLQIRANLCGEWRDCSYVIVRTRPIYYSWRWARGAASGSRGNRGGGSLCCLPPTQPWADGRFLLYDSVCVRTRKYRPNSLLININNHIRCPNTQN